MFETADIVAAAAAAEAAEAAEAAADTPTVSAEIVAAAKSAQIVVLQNLASYHLIWLGSLTASQAQGERWALRSAFVAGLSLPGWVPCLMFHYRRPSLQN